MGTITTTAFRRSISMAWMSLLIMSMATSAVETQEVDHSPTTEHWFNSTTTATTTSASSLSSTASRSLRLDPNIELTRWDRIAKNIGVDTPRMRYGYSVSISEDGNVLAVGAPLQDVSTSVETDNTGAVYMYLWNTLSASWEAYGRNVILGPKINDNFGRAVSLSAAGTRVAIGTYSNVVEVFEYNSASTDWELLGNPLTGDVRGSSTKLSADGARVCVLNDAQTLVQVHEYNTITRSWNRLGDAFGIVGSGTADERKIRSLDMSASGTMMALGASAYKNGNGLVQVFEHNVNGNNQWTTVGRDIFATDYETFFGSAVAFSEDATRIAISATADGRLNNNGIVRVYQLTSNRLFWDPVGQQMEGRYAEERLGGAITMSGDGLVVAANVPGCGRRHQLEIGCVRVFQYNGVFGTWEQQGADLNGRDNRKDEFGFALAISRDGSRLVIGAPKAAIVPGIIRRLSNYGRVSTYEARSMGRLRYRIIAFVQRVCPQILCS